VRARKFHPPLFYHLLSPLVAGVRIDYSRSAASAIAPANYGFPHFGLGEPGKEPCNWIAHLPVSRGLGLWAAPRAVSAARDPEMTDTTRIRRPPVPDRPKPGSAQRKVLANPFERDAGITLAGTPVSLGRRTKHFQLIARPSRARATAFHETAPALLSPQGATACG